MARFLSEKTLYLWHRIKAEKDVEQAGIEGLESCPFCPYSVVIENEAEKLFRCENEDCRAITCRKCKKAVRIRFHSRLANADEFVAQDHLPKSCKGQHIYTSRSYSQC
jgi:TRIAD3 protein (E3 ubiquitin-protein ligase RNF216)